MDRVKGVLEVVKRYRYGILVLLLGVALMLIPGKKETSSEQAAAPTAPQSTEPSLREQLESVLSQIEGAGQVRVLLSVETGSQTIYQTDREEASDNLRVQTVIVTGTDRAQTGLVSRKDPEKYLGAVVVCKGADRPAVRLAIVEAVAKLTGLGADQISVLKMK